MLSFSYQRTIYPGNSLIAAKYNAMGQFSNYLFYGYIFVIGIYDIYTIGIKKFRGFFHAFDLAMISIPMIYGLTELILNFNFDKDSFLGLLMLVYFMVFPYLFFKLFWKQNFKWYAIFFSYSSVFLLYVVVNLIPPNFFLMEIGWMSVPISYFLLAMYELCRHLFNKIKKVFPLSVLGKLKTISMIVPVGLIYSCMIILNFIPMQIDKTYLVESIYKENVTFTSMEEAENLARIAVDDTNSNIKMWAGTSQNFNNSYMFSIGNYSVDVDSATGKISEIRTQNEIEMDSEKTLNEEDIKGKTLIWLKNIGVTYDEKCFEMKVEKQYNKYIVNIFNKFNDGSIDNNTYCGIQWNINGGIYSANLGNLFNIDDYKEIKIDEVVIRENINMWYKKLGEETPDYVLKYLNYWFGDRDPSIFILCKNNDSFRINSENGEVLSFYRNTNENHDGEDNIIEIKNKDYDKFKSNAEEIASLFSSNWNKSSYKLIDDFQGSEENRYYYFETSNDSLIKYLNIKLDSQGNMISFDEGYRWSNEYRDKDFKISSSTALKLVSDRFKPLGIYTKRVKLAVEISESREVSYKWMVVVIPFKDVEHQIYYVDTETGEITALLNYS